MNTLYRVILVSGASAALSADLPPKPNLDQLKQIIRPYLADAHMERVRVLHRGYYTDMFVDEDGISKRLPVNVVASAIYRANWQAEYPATDPDELPAIYGTAVLFLRRVWF